MKRGAYGFSLALVGEGVLWLVTSIDIETFFSNELVLGSIFYAFSVVSMCIMLYLFKNGVAALDPNSTLSKQKSSTQLNKKGSDRLITRQESARSIRSQSKSELGVRSTTGSVSGRTRGATDDMTGSQKSMLASPLNNDLEAMGEGERRGRRNSDDDVQSITHTHREVDALMSLGADLDQVQEERAEFNNPVDIELPVISANAAVLNNQQESSSAPGSTTVSPVVSARDLSGDIGSSSAAASPTVSARDLSADVASSSPAASTTVGADI